MVQVAVGRCREFQGTEANVIKGFVIDTVGLVGILNQLMNRESGIVGFNDGVRYLRRWYDRIRVHNSVGIFFADLGDEQSAHTRSRATTERMGKLKSLKTIAAFSLLSDYVQNGIDEFRTLGVMTLRPVVSSTGLTENEVVRSEDLSERSGSYGIHSAWLKIDEDGPGYIFTTRCLIVINVDSL